MILGCKWEQVILGGGEVVLSLTSKPVASQALSPTTEQGHLQKEWQNSWASVVWSWTLNFDLIQILVAKANLDPGHGQSTRKSEPMYWVSFYRVPTWRWSQHMHVLNYSTITHHYTQLFFLEQFPKDIKIKCFVWFIIGMCLMLAEEKVSMHFF